MTSTHSSTIGKNGKWFPCLLLLLLTAPVRAWDYDGHRLVNQLALASLPTSFPAFVRAPAAAERIAFLSGEPDRWRNSAHVTLRHANGPDHFMDLDDLPLLGLDAAKVPPLRYQFVAQLTRARMTHSDKVPSVPAADPDQTKELIGFLPWTITEYFAKLQSTFSSLKAFEEAGTAEEVANAQANAVYLMGVMGHFVGDGSQPLHTTRHYNGWVGENPRSFTTNRTFHSWIDGGFLGQAKLRLDELRPRLRPAQLLAAPGRSDLQTNAFPAVMEYLRGQFEKVVPLYELEQQKKLASKEVPAEGKEFLTRQLLEAAQMLGDLWLTAWQQAPPDRFLKARLARRALDEAPTPP